MKWALSFRYGKKQVAVEVDAPNENIATVRGMELAEVEMGIADRYHDRFCAKVQMLARCPIVMDVKVGDEFIHTCALSYRDGERRGFHYIKAKVRITKVDPFNAEWIQTELLEERNPPSWATGFGLSTGGFTRLCHHEDLVKI